MIGETSNPDRNGDTKSYIKCAWGSNVKEKNNKWRSYRMGAMKERKAERRKKKKETNKEAKRNEEREQRKKGKGRRIDEEEERNKERKEEGKKEKRKTWRKREKEWKDDRTKNEIRCKNESYLVITFKCIQNEMFIALFIPNLILPS